jgi:hypothetical protein
MRFYTETECEDWLSSRGRQKPGLGGKPIHFNGRYPSEPGRLRFVAHWIATSITHRMPALLWITEWSIWPSSENWHLYYKLRQSYSDGRLLHEAPGHYFLEHEAEDLASFLQLAMLNGWGGYVLTQADYVNAFFSHDEFFDFFSDHSKNLDDVRETFGEKPAQG